MNLYIRNLIPESTIGKQRELPGIQIWMWSLTFAVYSVRKAVTGLALADFQIS
jgi:hypothetical protein